jgi:hypothetical protein
MLDTFIERWSGPLLVALGLGALTVGVYGLVTTSVPEIDPRMIFIYLGDPREKYEILSYAGVPLLIWGVSLIRYFRRERDISNRSP